MTRKPTLECLFAVGGTLALAAAAVIVLITRAQETVQAEDQIVVSGHATYALVPSLEALSHDATLIIVGSVVGEGQTRLVEPTRPQAPTTGPAAREAQLP